MGNIHKEDTDRSRVLGDLTMNHIIPIATRYQTSLVDNVYKMKDLFPADKASVLSARNLEIIEDIACRHQFHQGKGRRNDRSP